MQRKTNKYFGEKESNKRKRMLLRIGLGLSLGLFLGGLDAQITHGQSSAPTPTNGSSFSKLPTRPQSNTGVPFPSGSAATNGSPSGVNSFTNRGALPFERGGAIKALKNQQNSLSSVNRPLDLMWNSMMMGASPTWLKMLEYSRWFLGIFFVGWTANIIRMVMGGRKDLDPMRLGVEFSAAFVIMFCLVEDVSSSNGFTNGRLISESLNGIRNAYEEAASDIINSAANGVTGAQAIEAQEALNLYRDYFLYEKEKCAKLRTELAPVQSSNAPGANSGSGGNPQGDPYNNCILEASKVAKELAIANSNSGYLAQLDDKSLLAYASALGTATVSGIVDDTFGNYKGYTTGWSFWDGYSKLAKDYIYLASPAPIFVALAIWSYTRKISAAYFLLLIGIGSGTFFYSYFVTQELAAMAQTDPSVYILIQKDMNGAYERAQMISKLIGGLGAAVPIGFGMINFFGGAFNVAKKVGSKGLL